MNNPAARSRCHEADRRAGRATMGALR